MKILAKEWRSSVHTVGFIAYQSFEDIWSAAVGPIPEHYVLGGLLVNDNEDGDAQYIAQNGAKLSWQEAHVFFPWFDITKYKTYPEHLKEEHAKQT